jgi:uncharacterized 2Fe-2S/4Fe-4S cluster protein (DUF4445 family)
MNPKELSKNTIRIRPGGQQISAQPDQTLLESLIGSEIVLRSDCGGKGQCGKCRVKIIDPALGSVSAPDDSEVKHLSKNELDAGYRLACRAKASGDVSLEIPEASKLSAEVALKGPTLLFEKLTTLRPDTPGCADDTYGFAVDLGTTTIGVYLCDLAAGSVVASILVKNPQALFGDDVMSRITAVRINLDVLSRLQKMAIKAIEWSINSLCESTRIHHSNIKKMVVVGNSTMIHIFLGEDPSSMGVFPYTPKFVEQKFLKAESIGFCFNPKAEVHTLPLISGFIGSDIISAALVVDLHKALPGTMLVDVGTNGEIMLKGDDGLLATSCATGPAFEGASIRHGMQAVSGAIDAVKINRTSREVQFSVIQKNPTKPKKPSGICGSGVISAVATLFRNGILKSNGALDRAADSRYIRYDDKDIAEFILVPAENSQTGRALTLTQGDVRAIQLAKGALRAGIDLMCREAGRQRPEKILVAGAFGSYIDKNDAMAIGMFPAIPEHDIDVVGNAAGAGAILSLFDKNILDHASEIIKTTRVLELSAHPDFQDTFLSSLSFPDS